MLPEHAVILLLLLDLLLLLLLFPSFLVLHPLVFPRHLHVACVVFVLPYSICFVKFTSKHHRHHHRHRYSCHHASCNILLLFLVHPFCHRPPLTMLVYICVLHVFHLLSPFMLLFLHFVYIPLTLHPCCCC